jgi:endo-1,4-beta-xylanase
MEFLQVGRNEMLAVLREHIQAVAGRYKGRIWEWDVVNEAIGDGSETFRNSFLLQRIGEDFIDSAFHYAHRADPDARLYYNDYSAEDMGGKSNKVYALVKGMLERGVPIHGVGFQCHFRVESTWPTLSNVDKNIKRLHALGLKVSMTEVDWRVPEPADAAMLERQKRKYKELMAICLANPNCTSFLTWGIAGAALPFNNEYKPKPAYFGLSEALAQRTAGVIPNRFSGVKATRFSGIHAAVRINALGRKTPVSACELSW